jgi:hypothetical protein
MNNLRFWILFALMAAALAQPLAAAKKPLENIPLVWKPTSSLAEYGAIDLTGTSGVKVEVRELADGRENPSLIGENRDKEDKGIVLSVTTAEPVAPFVTENLMRLLGGAGLDAVASGGDVVVSGKVKRFFVLETSTYQGEVTLAIEARTPAGEVIWSGLAAGTAKRFGRTYKSENYYETLSDSLLDAAAKLLQNEAFIKALSRR